VSNPALLFLSYCPRSISMGGGRLGICGRALAERWSEASTDFKIHLATHQGTPTSATSVAKIEVQIK
jgi:hypothetical protein